MIHTHIHTHKPVHTDALLHVDIRALEILYDHIY